MSLWLTELESLPQAFYSYVEQSSGYNLELKGVTNLVQHFETGWLSIESSASESRDLTLRFLERALCHSKSPQ